MDNDKDIRSSQPRATSQKPASLLAHQQRPEWREYNLRRRGSSVTPSSAHDDDDDSPLVKLRQFSRAMDERYNILTRNSGRYRPPSLRALSIDAQSFDSTNGPSYASVKAMLNHLPVTPIFKETTVALSTKRLQPSIRRYRDVQVPLKDYEQQKKPFNDLRTALKKNSSEISKQSLKSVSFNEDLPRVRPPRHKTLSQHKYANLINLYNVDEDANISGRPTMFSRDRYTIDGDGKPNIDKEQQRRTQ
ncbi:hypothetical protein ACOME3_008003 [Neoechinorhynchus agilis]